jgi:hypothetical protein
MENIGIFKPEQHIPTNQKNPDWYRDNAFYWNRAIPIIPHDKLQRRLDLAVGKLKEVDYSYVTTPYGQYLGNMPAKLRNYPIIPTILEQLVGEFLKRPIEGLAFNKNSNIKIVRQEVQHKLIVEHLQQKFVNKLIESGLYVEGQTDEQGKPIQPPITAEKINEEVSSIVDELSESSQAILDYLLNTTDILTILKEIFYFYTIQGIGLSYKDIVNGVLTYRLIRPREFGYLSSPHVRFIEDAEATKVTYYRSYSDLIAMFDGDEEFDKIKNDLKSQSYFTSKGLMGFPQIFMSNFYGANISRHHNESGTLGVDTHTVTHIQWKSLTTIYRVYTIDEFGKKTHIDYDDRYIPLEGEEYEKKIVNDRHEVYIINNKYIVGGKQIEFSRGLFDNPNYCPGSYNGVLVKSYLDESVTIVDRLETFQIDYNIIKYIINKTINKNKDKIASIPLSLINGFKSKKGNVETVVEEGVIKTVKTDSKKSHVAESLYFADATQFLFIDDSELSYNQAQVAGQLLKQIDLGLGNYIQYLYEYAERIKEEAYDSVGFNRYRRAATGERDAVYNMQQGQLVGSLITEELFEDFRLFIEKEFLGLLDLALNLYQDNLTGSYYNLSDYSEVAINVLTKGLSISNIGIVVKSGGRTKNDFEQFKQAVIQRGGSDVPLSHVGKIMSASQNFNKMIKELAIMEKQAGQANGAAQEFENMIKQKELELKKEELDNKKEIEKDKLKLEAAKLNIETSEDSSIDSIINHNKDVNDKAIDNQFRLAELALKKEELATKRKESEEKIAVARINK